MLVVLYKLYVQAHVIPLHALKIDVLLDCSSPFSISNLMIGMHKVLTHFHTTH